MKLIPVYITFKKLTPGGRGSINVKFLLQLPSPWVQIINDCNYRYTIFQNHLWSSSVNISTNSKKVFKNIDYKYCVAKTDNP